MPSPFVPAGAVTGIGSLPFPSAASAISSVAESSPHIPFWPQLPQLSPHEELIAQGLHIVRDHIERRPAGYGYEVKPDRLETVLDLLHHSDGRLSEHNAAGFTAFEQALASNAFPAARAVKGQIEGPITLATYLFRRGRPFLSEPAWFAAVAFHVSQMVFWQTARLRASGLPVLLFIDEPALCLDGPSTIALPEDHRLSALRATLASARAQGALAGLHCCAASPFDRMCAVAPDLLSFDAHMGLEMFFAHPAALTYLERGGLVAYGLIPTQPRLAHLEPSALFGRWLAAAALAGDPARLARNALITATCGLGLLDPPAVEHSFHLAHAVGRLFAKLAAVDAAPTAPDRSSS